MAGAPKDSYHTRDSRNHPSAAFKLQGKVPQDDMKHDSVFEDASHMRQMPEHKQYQAQECDDPWLLLCKQHG
ncbi:hypothetical protein E2562_003454 [Oryza meyeriana var. granulata]|uniref:Uncharacterized protein n=1 Tax=Oryza meyeriana var. granulata TaxID=110450 RepID=A0A6G1EEL5_9ORYZ|nr:hypothetical protein E2562_003454 [Oryza meyeriana var. granulata]